MRRNDKEITENEEILELLADQKIGRLGTSFNDKPYITPVNYVYSNGKIYIHSANQGHKLDNISSNPNVCFEIEDVEQLLIKYPICASSVMYRSIIIFGTIRIVPDNPSKLVALTEMVEKYTGQPYTDSFTDSILGRVTVLEITITELTAKMSPAKPGAVRSHK